MNNDNESRLSVILLVSLLFILLYMLFLPRTDRSIIKQEVQTNSQTEQNVNLAIKDENIIKYDNSVQGEIKRISFDNKMFLSVDTYGGRITEILVNGKWNRMGNPISLLVDTNGYYLGDLVFGNYKNLYLSTNRPIYRIVEYKNDSIKLETKIRYKDKDITVEKEFKVEDNYTIVQNIKIINKSSEALKLDINGKSFTVASSFIFFKIDDPKIKVMNFFTSYYIDGKKYRTGFAPGLFSGNPKRIVINDPKWVATGDYYFLGVMKSLESGFSADLFVVNEDKTGYKQIVNAYQYGPILLEGNEVKTFTFSYYVGPKKESLVKKFDKSLSKIFSWPLIFNWFMKPIELLLELLLSILSKFISNWGILLILIAIIIKLMLSPLSIKSAISMKKLNLLQPKMKHLQDKYRDNPQLLNQKLAELYKKEKVNPLSGCFPILLQLPVFFALYRILSSSVELKGATFLWIKDLANPDTLFTMNIPLLPRNFNLLPIIMTVIQIVQMKIQTAKTPKPVTAEGQPDMTKFNTYVLPILFLFLFWDMPSGLVLYWTVQSIYSIVEQEVINLDKHIKLK